jgi:hypothetical protein
MTVFSVSAQIKVGFTLEKPVSFLTAHMDRIGSDIFEEIGVPNSKVGNIFTFITPSILLPSPLVNSNILFNRFLLFRCNH